jgi:hypothetical protein
MKRALAWIWDRGIVSTFLAGFLVILPLAITVWIMGWVAGMLRDVVGPDSYIGEGLRSVGLRFVANDTVATIDSPDHPQGWYELPEGVEPAGDGQRVFSAPEDAPAGLRSSLVHRRIRQEPGTCPLTGNPLVKGQYDLAQLRSLQDWHLRYDLAAVEGVSEVATVRGFVR